MRKHYDYDVIIIGAGIGGLVCGCYLAKAGKKVLIIEQHDKPGGYCTSFQKEGYTFDVAVDYLSSGREGDGIIYNILKDFALLDKIKFIRNDTHEKIVTPHKKIFIRQDKEKTKQELISNFPKEKESINQFFDFLLSKNFFNIISKTKSLTFNKLLNSFFSDFKLKSILSILIGNLGISPSRASALISAVLFREHIFDGGYYPQGGIQTFPNLLAKKFKEYGGGLLLSTKVKRINITDGIVRGIESDIMGFVKSKFIVSNADATSTFKELLNCDSPEKNQVDMLEKSPSAFIVYLGINKNLDKIIDRHFVTWYFYTYDINKCYDTDRYYNLEQLINKKNQLNEGYITYHFPSLVDKTITPPGKSVLRAVIWVKSKNMNIDKDDKENLYEKIIIKINELIPNIKDFIEIKEIATPYTLYSFTSNYQGSSLGWASTVSQIDRNVFPSETSIKGLYLTGHWVTNGIGQSGIPIVSLCGKNVAGHLLKLLKK